eukprot:16231945-Heterocapsa_arctica.AAC.1
MAEMKGLLSQMLKQSALLWEGALPPESTLPREDVLPPEGILPWDDALPLVQKPFQDPGEPREGEEGMIGPARGAATAR